jgi:hypothetical protein
MSDKPVIGDVGRPDSNETLKVEIIGELKPPEWAEFIECLKACAKRYSNKITITERKVKARIKSLDKP